MAYLLRFFSLLEAQSYDAASHSSLRQRFGLYPMADGARIRCAIGAVLPRAGMRAAKSQEKSKRNKATLCCSFFSGQPTFEAFTARRRPVQFLDVLPRSCQDGSRFSVTAREHACSTSPGEWQLRRRALSRRSRSPQTLKPGAGNGETRSSPRRRKIQNRRSSHTKGRGGGWRLI